MATKVGRKNKLERVVDSKETGLYKSLNAIGQLEYFGKAKIKGNLKQINLTKKYGATSKSKAEQRLKEWKVGLGKLNPSDLSNTKRTGFNTLDFMFLEDYISNHKNISIAKRYKGFYLKYIQKEIGLKKYDEVDNEDLQKLIDKHERLDDMSRRSLKKFQETLRPFYNELISQRKIKYNPAVRLKYTDPLRNERNLNDILIKNDLLKPITHILNEVENITNNKIKLMFYIAIYCGRRFGEIQSMKWDNVIIEEEFIMVHWYDNKSKNTSKFFINERIINLLNIIRKEHPTDNYVFQSNINRKDKKTPYMQIAL